MMSVTICTGGDVSKGGGKAAAGAAAAKEFRKNGPVKGTVAEIPKVSQKPSVKKRKAEVEGSTSKPLKAKKAAPGATMTVQKTGRKKQTGS